MQDRDLYARLLGIEDPWVVRDIDARLEVGEVEIFIALDEGAELACPTCSAVGGRYDTRTRTWRHLDTMQYKTLLTAELPRVECKEHGVKQVKVPWAEAGSRFTAMFEALVIDWLKEASTSEVARMLRMTWEIATATCRVLTIVEGTQHGPTVDLDVGGTRDGRAGNGCGSETARSAPHQPRK